MNRGEVSLKSTMFLTKKENGREEKKEEREEDANCNLVVMSSEKTVTGLLKLVAFELNFGFDERC